MTFGCWTSVSRKYVLPVLEKNNGLLFYPVQYEGEEPLNKCPRIVTYANLAALLSAAMKLLRLGQNASQTLLAEALREAPAAIAFAAELPFGEIGWFNPWLDIAAARHETADSRMFISYCVLRTSVAGVADHSHPTAGLKQRLLCKGPSEGAKIPEGVDAGFLRDAPCAIP